MAGKKRKNAGKFFTIAIVLFVFVILLSRFDSEKPLSGLETVMGTQSEFVENELRVQIIDVGQGDSILVECGGKSLLIDAGDNGCEQKIMNVLNSRGIKKLNYIIATHPHADHIGAMPEVITEFGTELLIMPKIPNNLVPTSATFSALLDAIEKNCDKSVYSSVGKIYQLGNATFKIVAPISQNSEDLNENSVVVRLEYGENSFLLTGDASGDEERELIDSGADVDCDVLKVGHHGSSTSSSSDFLKKVSPEICVISCGEDNRYGHPNAKTVKRLEKVCGRIYRTDTDGDVVFVSDGENLKTFIDGKEVS